jgi:DNA-binding XRE family transcriptional regulator
MKTKRDASSAEWLKRHRKVLGVSQKKLGELIHVHENTIINWERDGIPTIGLTNKYVKREVVSLIIEAENAKSMP